MPSFYKATGTPTPCNMAFFSLPNRCFDCEYKLATYVICCTLNVTWPTCEIQLIRKIELTKAGDMNSNRCTNCCLRRPAQILIKQTQTTPTKVAGRQARKRKTSGARGDLLVDVVLATVGTYLTTHQNWPQKSYYRQVCATLLLSQNFFC